MNTKQGFTLIELLVVVLIIGILSAVALPQYTKAVAKARAVEAITSLRAIETGQIAYFLANGVYTTKIDELDIEIVNKEQYGCSVSSGSFCSVTVPKTDGLFFEFVWPQVGWPSGQHRCLAPVASDIANQICLSYGGRFMRVESGNNFYLMP